MNTDFRTAMRSMARLPETRMAENWRWPGRTGEVLEGRDALYRSLEEEQAVLAQTPPRSEAEAILSLAEHAYGDLCGLLIGLDDSRLDAPPGNGEWPLREVLAHVLQVERSYLRNVAHALRRGNDEPLALEFGLELTDAERAGGVDDWIRRIAEARDATRAYAELSAAELERPSAWAEFELDVRFRLHRFASHLMEHTIQCEKVLAALGEQPSEPARIVRRICAVRGAHAARSLPQILAAMDGVHLDRARGL